MTTPTLKIKVLPKPIIKGKMDVRFPANVTGAEFLSVTKANGNYTLGVDYTLIGRAAPSDPSAAMIVMLDGTDGTYKLMSLTEVLASQLEQHITDPGPAAILPNAGIVRVDQTVGAAITLNMPSSFDKTCPVLISDWKGDSDTNNITISLTGSDTFPGGATSWTIAAPGGSVFLRPIPGAGYVI